MNKPIYLSLRESFSKDIYMPTCGVVAAPTVALEISSPDDVKKLTSDMPPQNLLIHIDDDLSVLSENGQTVCSLYDMILLCERCVPIICFESKLAADRLAEFCDRNNICDAIICTSYSNADILKYAYEKMPLLRGMLDCREEHPDIEELPSYCVSHEAVAVILSSEDAIAENIHSLSQRFIHVMCEDTFGFDSAACEGANGIITKSPDKGYAFLSLFPENSFLRRRNLFAHKGFQNNGKYSENTISGVVAAAENYFDGAEIDVKLTSDNIPVVMHNTNTKGLFDCEVAVTEESDYAFLSSLRRIDFENESIDKFEDLMFAMKPHKNTPVLIELKPSAKYNKVEELVRLTDEILRDEKAQKNCICIMGSLTPGLKYVHKHLPYLPVSHCEGGKTIPQAPESRSEAEDRLYRVALITEGCAAGYNCEDTCINRLFNEYAKFRMLTVFPWSRSWTLSPSKWEVNGPSNDQTYISGYDAWTTDHGEKYLDMPIAIELADTLDTDHPIAYLRFRDGHKELSACSLMKTGEHRALLSYTIDLHFGDSYTIYSKPFDI